MTACRFSLAPFGEPGKVMMILLFLTPATGLDIMATEISGISKVVVHAITLDRSTHMGLRLEKQRACRGLSLGLFCTVLKIWPCCWSISDGLQEEQRKRVFHGHTSGV